MKNKIIYSILFLKGRAGISVDELSSMLSISRNDIIKMINSLELELKKLDWPLVLKENSEGNIRLTISSKTSLELSKKMNKVINVSLSKTLLEVLTIIAYKQPVTKPFIENIKGTSVDYAIFKLLDYKLIISNERATSPGNPKLYVTTPTFLELFDLKSLEDLPKAPKNLDSTEENEDLNETSLFSYENDDLKNKIKNEVQKVKINKGEIIDE
ncbi:MAG: segregation and condensation protein B [Candidatus Tyloplasma litorale]|nr:MAG: segregation and condensation protein B [Mycoplasmatales bacterium]